MGPINKSPAHPHYYVFRLGSLRFGLHGCLGIASLLVTSFCCYAAPADDEESSAMVDLASVIIVTGAQVLTTCLGQQATQLLPQVPAYTQILPGIRAPHKEAFRRTISVLHYTVTRIATKQLLLFVQLLHNQHYYRTTTLQAVSVTLLVWRWWPLVPSFSTADLVNGNTWIFVMPIFIGVTGDLWQVLSSLLLHQQNDIVSFRQILQVQWIAQIIAFAFTLAFRNYLSMPWVYLGSAVAVGKIVQEGVTLLWRG